ncbi:GntR family transcriptional regulator [Agrobacterium tumefaciens]|uniref:GntR family transcriptional regulator n=1 Tax=Agrobacterium tumefaciens TaxID=358 RepID=UPI0015732C44|nr:GntR family transcriptional regulator [Agrobacterium tumefaciens]NSY99642.1 GntR family transcriptional regulator [Agrobacterium tumefaciens]NSZ36395.1 GntR family transcriptional regulator [Agrobacterium tumefaciens]NTB21911.1 GntR family transcriptional regulator [Agrobacterium tumefaciens]NTB31743.1 GntR family transcriptional regulator [Agrobacterium tumefaciens]NTB32224.1 GntR family transcriptional regulator [Agrobacterium tumefaciens]
MEINQSHSQTAYSVIFDLIISGEIAPDTAISTRSLSDRTGIGRTPIREALQALARDGMIDIVPTRGTFVHEPNFDEVREIYEVRVALEGMAAFLVAQRGVGEDLNRIGDELKALKEARAPDREAVRKKGWEFHDQLMIATGNAQLRQLYTQISRKFSLILRQGRKYSDERVLETLDEHIEMFDVLKSGDAVRAQTMMQEHIQRAFSARIQAISASPMLTGIR